MEVRLNTLLKEYGLDEKEIRIYLFLVGNEGLTAYSVAKGTSIHRSTTYDVLERLLAKGFVNKVETDGKTRYSADEISDIISNLKDKESILLSLIPKFERVRRTVKSRVRVLESESGQKQFNFNLFNLVKEGRVDYLYVLGNSPVSHISSHIFLERLIREAKQQKLHRKINYKGIWDEKFKNDKFIKIFSSFGENKFLKNLPSKVTIVIFRNYVAYLFTTDKPKVIEIQNKLIAEEMKSYFLYLWHIAR